MSPLRHSALPFLHAAIAGVGALVVLLLLIAATLSSWLESSVRAARLRDQDRAISSYERAMVRAESAHRGYLVTGHGDDLAAFIAAITDAERERMQIEMNEDRSAQPLLAEAWRTGEVAVAEWRQMMKLRDAQGLALVAPVGRPAASSAAGSRAVIDSLRSRLSTSIAAEAEKSQRLATTMLWLGSLTVVAILGTLGALLRVVARESDERRRLTTILEREAQHDSLTGLPNRRFCNEWLGYALAGSRREGEALGLLHVAVDTGPIPMYAKGLAPEIARRLRALKREGDLLARIDDGVFALAALHPKEGPQLASLAQRILRALADPPLPGMRLAPVTASVGVALFPDDANDLPGLVAAADSALASARRGQQRVVFHRAGQR